MNMRKVALTRCLYLLIFVVVSVEYFRPAQAQPNNQRPNWSVPILDCQPSICEVRLGSQGSLYIYDPTTWKLYISPPDGAAYTQVDLSAHANMIAGSIDFVPFDESHQVVFYSNTGSVTLSRYNVDTNQIEKLTLGISDKIVGCNDTTILRYMIPLYISRVGLNNQFLVCSYAPNAVFKVHIVDITAQNVLQSLVFENVQQSEGGLRTPWNVLLGGQDGNIYIETGQILYWPELTANLGKLAPGTRLVFKYSTNANTWTMNVVPLENMRSLNFTDKNITITRTVAIDTIGNSYYYHEWGEFINGSNVRHMEFTKLNPEFQAISRITDSDLSHFGVFGGNMTNGTVLFRVGNRPDDLEVKQIDDFLLNPIPTVTPTPVQPPTANAGTYAPDTDGNGSSVAYLWSENGTEITAGAQPTVTLAVGVHTIMLTVTDDDGATAAAETTIIVW